MTIQEAVDAGYALYPFTRKMAVGESFPAKLKNGNTTDPNYEVAVMIGSADDFTLLKNLGYYVHA